MKISTKQFAIALSAMLMTATVGFAQQNGGGGNGGFQGNGGGGGGGGRFNRQNQGFNNNNGGGNNGGGYGGFGGGGGNNGGGGYGGFGGGGGGRRNGGGFGGGGGGGFGRRNGGDPAAGVFGQSQSTDGIDIPTPDPMSGDYLALTSRSIFYHGRFVPIDPNQNQGDRQPREESLTVLVGLVNTDDMMTAYTEDQNSGQITPCHVGQEIAQGKVTRITLDEMDYQANGRIVHVMIGQNLVGQQIQGAGALLSTTLPSADLSGPNADILRRMMQRRQQELSGAAVTPTTAVPTPTMQPTVTPGR